MTLTGTLSATVNDDAVTFSFTVTNDGSDPVEASFSDAQRAECVVSDGGDEVWRWSDGQMFAMMMGSETFGPGDSETYELVWEEPGGGEFEARAELDASDADCGATTTLTV
jgi:hypothetical protein